MYTPQKRFLYRKIVPAGTALARLILPARKPVKPLSPPPFFILGSGRNGSTLLSAMLNKNPRLFLPPEQFVLPYAMMQWQLYLHKDEQKMFQRFLRMFAQEDKTSNWDVDFEALKRTFEENKTEINNFNEFVDFVFRFYGNKRKEQFIWGDQSPMMTHFASKIIQLFPAAKFVFLIRDPRDVILSCSKLKSSPVRNYKVAAWKWNDSIKTYDWLSKAAPERLLLVKYEDLVTQPQETITRISNFLEVPYTDRMLDHRKEVDNLGVSDSYFHSNLKNAINPDSIGKWKREFSPEMAKKVTALVASQMPRFGYK